MRIPPSQLDNQSLELAAIEKELREKALIFRSEVQALLKTAYATFSQTIYDSVTSRLHLIHEFHDT